jgi:hypothetical protein
VDVREIDLEVYVDEIDLEVYVDEIDLDRSWRGNEPKADDVKTWSGWCGCPFDLTVSNYVIKVQFAGESSSI